MNYGQVCRETCECAGQVSLVIGVPPIFSTPSSTYLNWSAIAMWGVYLWRRQSLFKQWACLQWIGATIGALDVRNWLTHERVKAGVTFHNLRKLSSLDPWSDSNRTFVFNNICGYDYSSMPRTHQCEHDDISNHRRLDCLPNRLYRQRSKKTSKLRVTSLCEGNPPMTGGFPSQRALNTENVSIGWRHHEHKINQDCNTVRVC